MKFLKRNPNSLEEVIRKIKNRETGCRFLNNYYLMSEEFLREVITFLLCTGRLVCVRGQLYITDYVEMELEEGCNIYFDRNYLKDELELIMEQSLSTTMSC